jgi:transcriptional regulator with XRE-family HTH domain
VFAITFAASSVARRRLNEHAKGMSIIRERFAAELRVAREAAGLTQEELAERADSSVDFLSKLERGLNSPSLETLASLMQALQIDPMRLFAVDQRKLTASHRDLEARAATLIRSMDDDVLLAWITIGHTIASLKPKPKPSSRTPGARDKKDLSSA